MNHEILTVLCGLAVGFSLGLTGGGGSIFAVPLLIYVLGADVRSAVGISLAAVGATSAFGVVTRWRRGEIDYSTGLIFAAGGMSTTPLGTWIGERIPPVWTLTAFALLMIFVGIRMWKKQSTGEGYESNGGESRSRSLGSWLKLVGIGLGVGIFTGIFGVGGGFLIVPALVLFGGVSIHRSVGTSLLVIAMICLTGVASYLVSGDGLPAHLTVVFVTGGCVGMLLGGVLKSRLSAARLTRVFAVAMWGIAVFMLVENFVG